MAAERFQRQFHQRWHYLADPHVRALAWLLDSPDLLDPHAPQWQGRIASLPDPAQSDAADWLRELDRHPQALHDALDIQPLTRLGRYAERLMAFYFTRHGLLAAHGVQVRDGRDGIVTTIGEFDFLLRDVDRDDALLHWELATKFYLLEPSGVGKVADYFVGPNLADTLGAKMHKILGQQLELSRHPAAAGFLPKAVSRAQALIKGWLFYHEEADVAPVAGIAANHCRGFWRELSGVPQLPGARFAILPRLQWLAPARLAGDQTMDRAGLQTALAAHFAGDRAPVLISILEEDGDLAIETDRGFIVPDDWRERAGKRVRRPDLL